MAGKMVVLVSGSGTNMEALVDACERGDVPGEVVAVLADRDCLALRAADKRGIPAETVDFASFDSREAWSEALRDAVARYEPELVVSAGLMRITSPVFVDAFSDRLINLHPSLLPAFPGPRPVRDALRHGVRVTGTTVHFIDYEVDHGAILLQEAVRIEAGDTEEALHERIKAVEHRLLPHACRLILEGKVELSDGNVKVKA
jgi:phosphoribosylglycinamide formyltransferase-1